jgi:Prion-inhibition and propagation
MDPGTALAIVSLSFYVFGGCVKGFIVLSEAHNLGQDASFLRTMLNLEEYRFTQWAKTVGLTGPDATLKPRLNQTSAAELMGQL